MVKRSKRYTPPLRQVSGVTVDGRSLFVLFDEDLELLADLLDGSVVPRSPDACPCCGRVEAGTVEPDPPDCGDTKKRNGPELVAPDRSGTTPLTQEPCHDWHEQ